MQKTPANFRALREECGLTQNDIADAFGVTPMSVKRWERGSNIVPDDVWNWMKARFDELEDFAVDAADRVEQIAAASAGNPAVDSHSVQLSYYRSQEELDEARMIAGLETEPIGYANAKTRAAGFEIEARGYSVEYVYGMQRFAD